MCFLSNCTCCRLLSNVSLAQKDAWFFAFPGRLCVFEKIIHDQLEEILLQLVHRLTVSYSVSDLLTLYWSTDFQWWIMLWVTEDSSYTQNRKEGLLCRVGPRTNCLGKKNIANAESTGKRSSPFCIYKRVLCTFFFFTQFHCPLPCPLTE